MVKITLFLVSKSLLVREADWAAAKVASLRMLCRLIYLVVPEHIGIAWGGRWEVNSFLWNKQ